MTRGYRLGRFPLLLVSLLFASLALGCQIGGVDPSADDDNDDNHGGAPADDAGDDTGDDTGGDGIVVAPVDLDPPFWPEWPLGHWVWEDESTRDSLLDLVQGYLDRDIPVDAVIIDSPWETAYNTFAFDEQRYPGAQGLIDTLHEMNVRVYLWITSIVNVDSPDYDEAKAKGYFLNNSRVESWWKGRGSYIDYWNPDAAAWWHSKMDLALDMGIDGWKVDMTDADLDWWLILHTADGEKLPFEYTQMYYRDFFNYTRERLGEDRVIASRPVDTVNAPWGRDFAPRDVSMYGWVGDQDPDFGGLVAALKNMFMSANRGHLMFGSDIGGYRGNGKRDKDLFLRWAQLGALSPVMENGGAGEHRPWMYDDETLAVYRDFVRLHRALAPYIYSQSVASWNAGISVMRPFDRATWEYFLGDWLLVAPVTEASSTWGAYFPEGTWIDYFDGKVFENTSAAVFELPLGRYPVFVRKGAIIPMDVRDGGVFSGGESERPPLTVNIWPDKWSTFDIYEEGGRGARVRYDFDGTQLLLSLSATDRAYAFQVHGEREPASVIVNPGGEISPVSTLPLLASIDAGWFFDKTASELWIKPGSAARGIEALATY